MERKITNEHQFRLRDGRDVKIEVYRARFCLAYCVYVDGKEVDDFIPITSCWNIEGLERTVRFLLGERAAA